MDSNYIMSGTFCLTLSNILKASRASCTCCFVSGGIGNSLMMFLFNFALAANGKIVGPVAEVEGG